MARLIYSTELTINGPWLIDHNAVMELDNILDDAWEKLCHEEDAKIDNEANKEFQEDPFYRHLKSSEEIESKMAELKARIRDRWYRRRKKSIRIDFIGSKSLIADSFKEAYKDRSILDDIPIGFRVQMDVNDIEASIRLTENDLSVNVSPESLENAREFFVLLRQWMGRYKPPVWQRVWTAIHGFHWFMLVILLSFGYIFVDTSSTQMVNLARDRARSLLDAGLTEENTVEAVGLLLMLESRYFPGYMEAGLPHWFNVLFWGGLFVSIVLTIKPKSVVGLGKGEDRIKLWRWWLGLISVTIPGLVFTSFLWPYIVQFIQNIL